MLTEIPTIGQTPLKRLEPLHDYVVFRAVLDDRTEGGIVLPDKAKGMRKKALVIAVGPGRLDDYGARVPMSLKPGDTVILAANAESYCASEATGETLHLCKEDDIVAKVLDDSLQ
jgi:chaperonin GroES